MTHRVGAYLTHVQQGDVLL